MFTSGVLRATRLPWTSYRGRRVARSRVAFPAVAELTAADVKAALREELQPINASLQALIKEELQPIKASLQALQGQLSRLEASQAHLYDESVRSGVASCFGHDFALPARVRSLDEAVTLLLLDRRADMLVSSVPASEAASFAMADAGLPLLLFRRCERVAAALGGAAAPCGAWLCADGSVDGAAVEAALAAAGDTALAVAARKLRSALGLDRDATAARLRARDGPGMVCLVAAALPEKYMSQHGDALPGEQIQLDAAGRITRKDGGGGSSVLVADVGVIKRNLNVNAYATAVHQLGVALALLRWLAATCFGCDAGCAELTGRLFVPRSVVGDAYEDDARQCERARLEYGYMLCVDAM